jgi:hypothetical protein
MMMQLQWTPATRCYQVRIVQDTKVISLISYTEAMILQSQGNYMIEEREACQRHPGDWYVIPNLEQPR